jgi:diamine N-acetyltransferase
MLPPSFHIRKALPDDLSLLCELSTSTFLESYLDKNDEDNMQSYVGKHFSPEALLAEMNNPRSEFYLALVDGTAVGYLKTNTGDAQTEPSDPSALEIERIYVLKEFQAKTIGRQLFMKALDIAHRNSCTFIWLGVWEENPGAIAFYKKLGFKPFGRHIFRLGNEEQWDIMMKFPIDK